MALSVAVVWKGLACVSRGSEIPEADDRRAVHCMRRGGVTWGMDWEIDKSADVVARVTAKVNCFLKLLRCFWGRCADVV